MKDLRDKVEAAVRESYCYLVKTNDILNQIEETDFVNLVDKIIDTTSNILNDFWNDISASLRDVLNETETILKDNLISKLISVKEFFIDYSRYTKSSINSIRDVEGSISELETLSAKALLTVELSKQVIEEVENLIGLSKAKAVVLIKGIEEVEYIVEDIKSCIDKLRNEIKGNKSFIDDIETIISRLTSIVECLEKLLKAVKDKIEKIERLIKDFFPERPAKLSHTLQELEMSYPSL